MTKRVRSDLQTYIGAVLREEIVAGKLKPGDCLPSIKVLADRFGTSISPVHRALLALETEGVVECRVGDGTFVTQRRPVGDPLHVALFVKLQHPLFSALADIILSHLHRLRIYPVTINAGQEAGEELLTSAVPAARVLIVISDGDFPFDVLRRQSLKGKRVIDVLAWSESFKDKSAGFDLVLLDHAAGGRLVAEHFQAKGCKRVVVLGTKTMVNEAAGTVSPSWPAGAAFEQAWRALGGEVSVLAARPVSGEADPKIVPGELLALMAGATRETAVFGCRDFEAWQAQDILLGDPQRRFEDIEIVGYGNTPWSQAARPPITTVDWNLEAVAAQACELIEAAVTNRLGAPESRMIMPRLIVRGRAGEGLK